MKRDHELQRETLRFLEPMRREPLIKSGHDEVEQVRSAALPRLARLIEAVPLERARKARQRRLVRAWLLGVAAGLSVAAGALLWGQAGSSDTRSVPGAVARLRLVEGQLSQRGTPLSAGVQYTIETLGRLSTPPARGAQLVTDEGVRVALGANSTADLNFTAHNRHVALNRGSIELSVPKLAEGSSLSVATPDAVVTVHGTRFSVGIRGTGSCVRVSEGVVSVVRGERVERLTAGQASGCEPKADPSATEPTAGPDAEHQASTDFAARASRRSRGTRAQAGTLTQENRLFESILALEQAQRWSEAETLAERLLSRYPDSPMVAETRRVLARVKAQHAIDAAAP